MELSPEWAAMSERDRRWSNWYWGHHVHEVQERLEGRFGERAAGASFEEFGKTFKFRVYVKALALDEVDSTLHDLGEQAHLVDLVPVERSMRELRDLQEQVEVFIRATVDADAYSGGSTDVRTNRVRLVIRPGADDLWGAVLERFGSAVAVEWGVVRFTQEL